MKLLDLFGPDIRDFFSINPAITPESEIVKYESLGEGLFSRVTRYDISGQSRAVHRPVDRSKGLGPAHITKTNLEYLADVPGLVSTQAIATTYIGKMPGYGTNHAYCLMVQELLPPDYQELKKICKNDLHRRSYLQRLHWMTAFLETVRGLGQAGIVHRDLKPANVWVNHERTITTDLGFAAPKGMYAESDGSILGTPHYMSPEQAEGDILTNASDVHAWGAIFAEVMQTKGFPARGSAWGIMMGKATGRPPSRERITTPEPLKEATHAILELALARAKATRDLDSIAEQLERAREIATAEGL